MGTDKELDELIEGLERCCDLFEKVQEKKAVIEAEEIIKSNEEAKTQ